MIARFWNAGQSCLAAKRLYVFDEIYDDFVSALVGGARAVRVRRGLDAAREAEAAPGARAHAAGRDELSEQLEDAVSRGASVLHGGGPPSDRDKGFYFQPTLVESAPHDSRLVTEEVFGPILPVFRVQDIDEAIGSRTTRATASDRRSGPYDARYIDRAAQEIEAGMTWVNQIHYGYDELPFGGLKESGLGKEHGMEAMLDHYLETKSVVVGGLG